MLKIYSFMDWDLKTQRNIRIQHLLVMVDTVESVDKSDVRLQIARTAKIRDLRHIFGAARATKIDCWIMNNSIGRCRTDNKK